MMDSTLIAVRMILVGYLIFMLFLVKPKVCLLDYVFVGPPLLGCLILLFWHYDYSWFACIGMHLGMCVATVPWAWKEIFVTAR